jgi:hypothetical protein
MRAYIRMGLAVLVIVGPMSLVPAGEPEEIKAVVDAAIAARGGEAKLKGVRAAVWKSEGISPTRATRASLYGQVPGQFRLESERFENGKITLFIKIINGDKGWTTEGGRVRAMTKDEMTEVKQTFYFKHLDATLLPLRDKDVRVSRLGESKIEGRAVVGLKVSRKGMPDAQLYFDKHTMLLVKSEHEVLDETTGKKARHEVVYDDYQVVDGVKFARHTRRYLDGKLTGDVRITQFELRPKLDDHLFKPPLSASESEKP